MCSWCCPSLSAPRRITEACFSSWNWVDSPNFAGLWDNSYYYSFIGLNCLRYFEYFNQFDSYKIIRKIHPIDHQRKTVSSALHFKSICCISKKEKWDFKKDVSVLHESLWSWWQVSDLHGRRHFEILIGLDGCNACNIILISLHSMIVIGEEDVFLEGIYWGSGDSSPHRPSPHFK